MFDTLIFLKMFWKNSIGFVGNQKDMAGLSVNLLGFSKVFSVAFTNIRQNYSPIFIL